MVVTDLRMKSVDGLDVLDGVKRADPTVPVIIMTAFGAIESAVEAMRRGAFHYVTKPFELRRAARAGRARLPRARAEPRRTRCLRRTLRARRSPRDSCSGKARPCGSCAR